jgi:arylsulfatase A-like enzyme
MVNLFIFNMISKAKLSGPLALTILLFIAGCGTPVKQPNIILVMTDDQGWFDAGFNGNGEIKTPFLDHIASQGIILDRFYAASAVCSPTRASVITGRNPLRMEIPNANAGHMKEEEITLPEILKTQGYATGHFGKWHLGTLTRNILDANRGGREQHAQHFSIPTMHGYDEFFCTESKVPTYDPMKKPLEFEDWESLRYGWKAREDGDSTEPYGTAYWIGNEKKAVKNLDGDNSKVIMDRVLPFIERSSRNNSPFFATIWFHTPHLPVVADEKLRSLYPDLEVTRQVYYGTISGMDEQMGLLWNKLEQLGILEETMIWFCSDNGPENGTPGSAGPFRERKRSLYEGGVRVPAFVVWKGQLEGGSRAFFPAVTSDYLPTILHILDINYPENRPLDGTNLWDLLRGDSEQRKQPIGFIFRDKLSWVENNYKLVSVDKGASWELYNVVNDRSEQMNLIDTHPDIAARMTSAFESWISSVEKSQQGEDYW